MKPILFNTEMVRAILEDRKTVTRRCIKRTIIMCKERSETLIHDERYLFDFVLDAYIDSHSRYKKGDILYVRETWNQLARVDEDGCTHYDKLFYVYKADKTQPDLYDDDGFYLDDTHRKWKSSIHMPKEAARLFLRVTDVRVERLQDITYDQMKKEGLECRVCAYLGCCDEFASARICNLKNRFIPLWNSTIEKSELDLYGWDANPWVFVYEFEKISKEEAIREGKNI